MELEEVLKDFKKLIELRKSKTTGKIKYDNCIVSTEQLEIILKALEESIPKKVIEDKILELRDKRRLAIECGNHEEADICLEKILVLQDLLKGEK